MVPPGLMIVIALLAAGFFFSMVGTIRVKAKEGKYQKLEGTGSEMAFSPGGSGNGPNASYQNPNVSHYAIPPQQKVNTYCVIDSRLVDNLAVHAASKS